MFGHLTLHGWPAGLGPTAPAGFTVNRWADGLDYPRWFHLLPNGDDYINDTQSHDRQVALFFDGTYNITEALKLEVGLRYAWTHFDFHNLKTEYLPQRNDIIFCRNVMMYFDEAEQKRLIEKFGRCLNPEGYLFVGHAESLRGMAKSMHDASMGEFRRQVEYKLPFRGTNGQ